MHEVKVGEDQHDDGTEEAEDGEERHYELTGVPLTEEPPPTLLLILLLLLIVVESVVWSQPQVRHTSDSGVISPVISQHLNLTNNWNQSEKPSNKIKKGLSGGK